MQVGTASLAGLSVVLQNEKLVELVGLVGLVDSKEFCHFHYSCHQRVKINLAALFSDKNL